MRIFDPDAAFKSIDQLGFSPQEAAGWNALVERPHGIVLVTGPTGSGKTTTLYSTLKRLATPDVNVCTVEDPIEMIAPEFNQMQVQANIDLDFASGVRAAAAGPGHHHDRRDPRPGNRADGGAGLLPATWCCPRCIPTTRRRRSPACSTWACRTTCWPAPSTASSPSAWCARCARTASSRTPLVLPTGRCWLIAKLHIQMPPRPVVRSVAWSAGAPDSSAASACMSCCHWARGCVGRSAPTWIWPVSPVPRGLKGCEPCARPGLKRWRRG